MNLFIRILERLCLALDELATSGLEWCDRHCQANDTDETIAEIEAIEKKFWANPPKDIFVNVVHLPRRRYFGTRRVH